MRFRQGLFALAATLAFVAAGTPEARAAQVFFEFVGKCQGVANGQVPLLVGGGCNAFGLDEGDLVSGSLGLDMDAVVGGNTVDVFDLAGSSFAFTFGNQSFDLSDFSDVIFEVTFSLDAQSLTCMSGLFGCPGSPADFVAFDNGPAALLAYYDRVDIQLKGGPGPKIPKAQAIDPPPPPAATAKGSWQRRVSDPIPEPSAALLFAVGGLVIHMRRRRRK